MDEFLKSEQKLLSLKLCQEKLNMQYTVSVEKYVKWNY